MIASPTFELEGWQAARDAAMASVERNAGPAFSDRAREHVMEYLRRCGESSGEAISSAGEAAGIVAHDSRAWGPVFQSLSSRGRITKAGYCARTKGHGTAGGIVWRIAA